MSCRWIQWQLCAVFLLRSWWGGTFCKVIKKGCQNIYVRKYDEGLKTAVTCRVIHVQITVKRTSIQALSSISYIFFGRQAWIKSLWVTSTCWRPSSTIPMFRTGASKSRDISCKEHTIEKKETPSCRRCKFDYFPQLPEGGT